MCVRDVMVQSSCSLATKVSLEMVYLEHRQNMSYEVIEQKSLR